VAITYIYFYTILILDGGSDGVVGRVLLAAGVYRGGVNSGSGRNSDDCGDGGVVREAVTTAEVLKERKIVRGKV
jgi:hypothetical protein